MRQSIPLKNVKINPRMRKEMGNIEGLADSIRRNGLIQPIVLTPDFTLVAGERRYRAHELIGAEVIDYVLVHEIPEDVQAEIEFEENFYRKSMTWQEEALGILNIYRKKKRAGALGGFVENWTQTVAEMFSMAVGTCNYILAVARKLEDETKMPEDKRRYWNFGSTNEAYRLGILAEKEDAAIAHLADLSKKLTSTVAQQVMDKAVVQEATKTLTIAADPVLLSYERERYEKNPHNTVPFDQYWAEKQKVDLARKQEVENTVYLSNSILNCDCIDYMNHPNRAGRFNHIITDPPYGIDMDNLRQGNGGMTDIDRVKDMHEVGYNMTLLEQFFPAAFKCTKDNAFVILFCDTMVWQYLYDNAIEAGFAVQRWPIIWRKVNQSVSNNCASYNTTKDFELVMVCRKPGTTVSSKMNTSIIDGSNSKITKMMGHPFSKPLEVTEKLIDLSCFMGQEVLEPFAGSGSIVLSLLQKGMKVVACEKEVHHYNQMLENLKREHYLKLNPKFTFK